MRNAPRGSNLAESSRSRSQCAIRGRDVSLADTAKSPAVAIVNQEFARRLFHSEEAVGRHFKNPSGVSIQIVGIMADGKHFALSEDPETAAFFPISQHGGTRTSLIVRTPHATADMVATIRELVRVLAFQFTGRYFVW
jgi:hypothetical protein